MVHTVTVPLVPELYDFWGALVPAFITPCPGFTVGKPRLVVVAVQGAPLTFPFPAWHRPMNVSAWSVVQFGPLRHNGKIWRSLNGARIHSEPVSANTAAWEVSPLFELPHDSLRDIGFINVNPVGMNAAL